MRQVNIHEPFILKLSNLSKNPAGFSTEEVEILDKIVGTLTIKLNYYLEIYKDPHKYDKELSEVVQSDSFLGYAALFLNIKSSGLSKGWVSPEEINKELATKLSEESEALNSPALSKVLGRFKEENMLNNIRGKDDVKQLIPHVIRRKKFSKDPKPQGRFSFHKITDEIEKYQRILSNPQALKLITDRLNNFGLLEPAYTIIAKSIFYAMMNSDERGEKFFRMVVNAGAPNIKPESLAYILHEAELMDSFRCSSCSHGNDV